MNELCFQEEAYSDLQENLDSMYFCLSFDLFYNSSYGLTFSGLAHFVHLSSNPYTIFQEII